MGLLSGKEQSLHADEMFSLAFPLIETKDAEAAARLKEKYAAEAERYRDEIKEIQTDAKKLEEEIRAATARANRSIWARSSSRSAWSSRRSHC